MVHQPSVRGGPACCTCLDALARKAVGARVVASGDAHHLRHAPVQRLHPFTSDPETCSWFAARLQPPDAPEVTVQRQATLSA